MKNNFKNEMIAKVEELATKKVENGVEMTAENFNKFRNMIDNEEFGGKFTIVANKKNDKLFAVVYKTKKSNKLVIIRIVEVEKKVEKKATKKSVKGFTFKFKMLNDKGLDVHVAEFEMTNASQEEFNLFFSKVNEHINDDEILEHAKYENVVSTINGFTGKIVFPKIKGHSKDGYASYKKCVVAAKRDLRA